LEIFPYLCVRNPWFYSIKTLVFVNKPSDDNEIWTNKPHNPFAKRILNRFAKVAVIGGNSNDFAAGKIHRI
jgi:hypothetical protein